MTERLSTLMQEEVLHLAIPPAPAATVLTAGRRSVRRRRIVTAAVTASALACAGVAIGSLVGRDHGPVALDPATAAQASDWAVAQGSTIHLGTGETAKVPGQVKALYYTSAGTLVRIGATPDTDAPDSNYWLARPDGSVSDFDLHLGDRVPGTDPTLPYLAYADEGVDDSHWTVVVRDVRTGEVARRIPVEGRFTWGGWVAPPVSLAGDHVYVGVDGTLLDVAWRTGEVRSTTVPTHMPETRGTHDVVSTERRVDIVDVPGGEVVWSTPRDLDTWPRLSPDGSHVLLLPTAMCDENDACTYEGKPSRIVDLGTGEVRTATLGYGAYGWSATGDLLLVEDHEVRSCDPDTMRCVSTDVELDGQGPVRVSGNDNES